MYGEFEGLKTNGQGQAGCCWVARILLDILGTVVARFNRLGTCQRASLKLTRLKCFNVIRRKVAQYY